MLDRHDFFQIAYYVRDLEAAIDRWTTLFGAGPFVVAPHHKTDRFSYRGTDAEADVSYAFGYLGEMMIQFIQQHDQTPSIYLDMYPEDGEGYHHHGVLVRDYEAEKQRLTSMGFELACELHADNVDACYVDTRAVSGGFTELHADPPHIIAAFAYWKRAHQLRKPGDPQILQRP
ncbi:MAG: VOC family protein [Pseudomonadota bacterium]